MFLEHVPFTLRNWLSPHLIAAGGQKATELVRNVEHELLGAAERMRSEGWVHFDAHLDNVLTTSQHLVMSDFGLASSVSFQLDAAEQQFLKRHADHDVAYCIAELTNAILRSAMSFPVPGHVTTGSGDAQRLAKQTEFRTHLRRRSCVSRPQPPS